MIKMENGGNLPLKLVECDADSLLTAARHGRGQGMGAWFLTRDGRGS